jgi:hypothetical protein
VAVLAVAVLAEVVLTVVVLAVVVLAEVVLAVVVLAAVVLLDVDDDTRACGRRAIPFMFLLVSFCFEMMFHVLHYLCS